MDKNFIVDIGNRNADYNDITKELWATELGIRAVCVMYDEHSSDQKSHENIHILKKNIEYRLFSAVHQYLIFLIDLKRAENDLQVQYNEDNKAFRSFPMGNPYYDKVEIELSSIFDSIIFHLTSVFDYLGHMTSYICQTNKSSTLYWTKLAKAARGKDNDISKLKIRETIDAIDRVFIGRLYDYRSRLLHNWRDKHNFVTIKASPGHFAFMIVASQTSLKEFKLIRKTQPEGNISLTYLASWLIRQTFIDLEKILDSLQIEICAKSCFYNNLFNPKTNIGFNIVYADPQTHFAKPVSDVLWNEYKTRVRISSLPTIIPSS